MYKNMIKTLYKSTLENQTYKKKTWMDVDEVSLNTGNLLTPLLVNYVAEERGLMCNQYGFLFFIQFCL